MQGRPKPWAADCRCSRTASGMPFLIRLLSGVRIAMPARDREVVLRQGDCLTCTCNKCRIGPQTLHERRLFDCAVHVGRPLQVAQVVLAALSDTKHSMPCTVPTVRAGLWTHLSSAQRAFKLRSLCRLLAAVHDQQTIRQMQIRSIRQHRCLSGCSAHCGACIRILPSQHITQEVWSLSWRAS